MTWGLVSFPAFMHQLSLLATSPLVRGSRLASGGLLAAVPDLRDDARPLSFEHVPPFLAQLG
jgi:hypothetical protein